MVPKNETNEFRNEYFDFSGRIRGTTYFLRALLEKFGGLHGFNGWNGPILTDSGGFQVWSLAALRNISEEGVRLASPINGDRLFLTPETSMQIQTALNAEGDIPLTAP